MADPMGQGVINWFDIPVAELDRATRFYESLLGAKLQRYRTDRIEGALFPPKGTSGTLLKGKEFVPSHAGAVVYLDGGDDLNRMLEKVEGAGGKVLLQKTEIPGGRGFFAYFEDTEGNRVGLHSPG